MPTQAPLPNDSDKAYGFQSSIKVVAEDLKTLHRLVGFYEYSRALKHFEAFFATASSKEVEAADQIIANRDEFSIFVNLSRLVQPAETTLREMPRKSEDAFERRGLAWLMALARVETQAMMSAFTDLQAPFSASKPMAHELFAYQEILCDGMRTHYWDLRQDPGLDAERNATVPSSRTLAYLRRTVMTLSFIAAFERQAASSMTVEQRTELRRWKGELWLLRTALAKKVSSALNVATLDRTAALSRQELEGVQKWLSQSSEASGRSTNTPRPMTRND